MLNYCECAIKISSKSSFPLRHTLCVKVIDRLISILVCDKMWSDHA